ncbi:MAG: hypothetical protein ACOH19_15210 [Rhodoglobus sp.]
MFTLGRSRGGRANNPIHIFAGRMKVGGLLREVVLNVKSGTTRTVILTTLFAFAVIALLLTDLGSVKQLSEEASAFQRAGASIITLSAPGQVSSAACDGLNAVDGVTRAGALRESERRINVSALPQSPLKVYEVSDSFPGFLTSDFIVGGGIVLSRDAISAHGKQLGDALPTTTGPILVGGIYDYPNDGRRQGLGYAALVFGEDDQPYDECWIESWPQIDGVDSLLLATVLPRTDAGITSKPVLSQLNSSLGERFDGASRFENRPSRFAALGAGGVGLLLGFVSIRVRRVQFASAMHSRVLKRDLTTMVILETASWSLPALALTYGIAGAVASDAILNDRSALQALGSSIALCAVAGAMIGSLSALLMTREAHLFRYSKDR